MQIWLIRHGETEWSRARRHTGRTDIALTSHGEQQGRDLQARLKEQSFSLVLTSPLRRARDTCNIAGYATRAIVAANLCEWDYGVYEGRTTAAIQAETPGWDIWDTNVGNGESIAQVGARVDQVIKRAKAETGNVALFAHAHLLRVLAARWLRLQPVSGRCFTLDAASISILGYERKQEIIARWNDVSHLS